MPSASSLNRLVRTELCTKNNVYAFLTGEDAHRYGRCFISADKADNFWNANQQQAQAMLQRFRASCVRWADKRYQPLVMRINTSTRVRVEQIRTQKLQQDVARQRAQTVAETQRHTEQAEQRGTLHRKSLQDALTTHSQRSGGTLRWSAELAIADPPTNELTAYLLATRFSASGDRSDPKHAQQLLNKLLGKPQVEAVTATGNINEYRVRIQSSYNGFTVDAFVNSEQPLTGDILPWVLFKHREHELIPTAVVLQTSQQTLAATRLEGSTLPLRTLPKNKVTRLPENISAVRVQLRCVPHDGGKVMPLNHCLKADGEISVLTATASEQYSYKNLSRKQRNHQFEVKPPFVITVLTGKANRRGELQLKIIDLTQTDKPALFNNRAIAKHDSLFVYAE